MSDDSHAIPDDTAAHYARLINDAEDMRQLGADTLKQVYSDLRDDLKQLGWVGASVSAEVAALKGAIAEMRLDEKAKTKRDARGDRVDDYVSVLTRARARGDRPKGDISPRLAKQVIDGMQTEAGRAVLLAAVETMIEREEADEEFQTNPEEGAEANGAVTDDAEDRVEGDTDHQRSPEAGTTDGGRQGVREQVASAPVPASNSEIDPNEDRKEGQSLDVESADANTGGDHEVGDPNIAAQAGVLVQSAPAANGVIYESAPKVPMKSLGFAHCFPELSKAAYQALVDDIARDGVLEPIIRKGDVIVNGWNRYNAARSLGIEYPVVPYSGDDLLTDVIKWQRSDRDWTTAQERKIAEALAKAMPDRANDVWAAFYQAPAPDGEEVAA